MLNNDITIIINIKISIINFFYTFNNNDDDDDDNDGIFDFSNIDA